MLVGFSRPADDASFSTHVSENFTGSCQNGIAILIKLLFEVTGMVGGACTYCSPQADRGGGGQGRLQESSDRSTEHGCGLDLYNSRQILYPFLQEDLAVLTPVTTHRSDSCCWPTCIS